MIMPPPSRDGWIYHANVCPHELRFTQISHAAQADPVRAIIKDKHRHALKNAALLRAEAPD
jgi:hypothetical protein